MSASSWIGVGATVRGARHVRLEEANEDSFKAGTANGRAVALVADGHGSAKCTRADVGSAIAVEIGFEVLAASPAVELHDLPELVASRWRDAVDAHLVEHPPTPAEIEAAPHPHHLLYGTTLLGAAIDGTTLRVFQVGDGDVLLGRHGHDLARRPIPPLEVDRPGQTDSLCQADAAARTLAIEYDLEAAPVDVVLLASDGLDTAFAEPTWHDETITDVLRRVQGLDSDAVEQAIVSWCEQPAAIGGDDTTIVLLLPQAGSASR